MAANQTCDDTTTDSIDDDFNDFSRRETFFELILACFITIPRNSGALYDVTQVLDTYIYNGANIHRRFWYDGCCRTLSISCWFYS